ncbi:MAG: 3D domain-containing protein [Oscillospiraceae bacterium]|nr:3D domain-containing protein [Oscillospiraceae bacterium]
MTGYRRPDGSVNRGNDIIPLGTWVWIPGYGYALTADRGGWVIGNHIDVFIGEPGDVLYYPGARTLPQGGRCLNAPASWGRAPGTRSGVQIYIIRPEFAPQ